MSARDACFPAVSSGAPWDFKLLLSSMCVMQMSVQAPQRHALYDPNQHRQHQTPVLQPA